MAGTVNAGDPVHFSRTGVGYLGRTYLTGYWQAQRNTRKAVPSAVPLAPTRFLDTRSSSGQLTGGPVSFQVAGVKGVPADAAAVAVNLTVTGATSYGFITAYASGKPKPGTSSVNYQAGQTVANLAIVPVGGDGKVTLSNTSAGSVQLVADVSAYFRAGTPFSAGTFQSVDPARFLDTRSTSGPVPGGRSVSFTAGGASGIPVSVSAVVVNLTATETKSLGFLTAHAAGTPTPNASNVNYSAGQTVANLVVVPVGRDGRVTISNTSSGSAQVVADVAGFFLPGVPEQARAVAVLPATRFLDTRLGSGRVPAGGSVGFQARGIRGVPANAAAVIVNLTVTESRSHGYLTAFASASPRPNASNLNYGRGQTVPNLAVVPIGADGKVRITNTSGGTVQIIADVTGYISK